ncbi:hypothetical protein ACFJIW_06060 [Tahibacter sp. UC22_41]|uniref:hypothetical protein n=1 Tax=Tahibacter sp. UC22_41 TaxID=3350178 RepID=UPI0036DA2CAF
MPLTESQRADLFAALESRGWSWKEGFIYAPHRSLWLLGSSPWTGDLPDFHERMRDRLQRIEWLSPEYDDPHYHRKVMDDTASLVDVLARMLAEKPT